MYHNMLDYININIIIIITIIIRSSIITIRQ